MGSRLIRTSLCAVLLIAAAQARADGQGLRTEYGLQAGVERGIPVADPHRPLRSDAFIRFMSKPFALVTLSGTDTGYAADTELRWPDPQFGVPKAFRRRAQLHLGFSIRF